MSEPTVDILTHRLDRLERANRRWKIAGSIIGAILATVTVLNLVLLVGTTRSLVKAIRGADSAAEEDTESEEAAVEEEVRAKAFVLVGEDGKPRAALALRSDGTAALAFSDKNGQIIWKAP